MAKQVKETPKKNPYDKGTDGYYYWMKKNEPAKHKALQDSIRKDMGLSKKAYKKLPDYANPPKSKR